MIQGAIFDLDGTLLDSMGMWDRLGEAYLRAIGYDPRPDLNEQIRTLTLEQTARFFQQEYAVLLPAEAIVDGVKAMIRHYYEAEVMPKPGVEALLAEFQKQGVRMCIATATDRDLAEAALVRCGLMKYFTGILTCSEVGSGKDQPDIYRRALAHLGTEKGQTAVFEDAVHALRTAKADGFVTVAVHDDSEPDAAGARALADWYLPDYSQADRLAHMIHSEGKDRQMRRCVIIGGANIGNYEVIREQLREDDFCIFCDSGLRHMADLRVSPELIVGDFDSHPNPGLAVETIILPCEKDDTDTVYAVKEALKRGYEEFLLIGVIGARLDHTLGNVSILLYLDALGKTASIFDDYSQMQIVSGKPVHIDDSCAFFSLLNISGTARGVTIENAKYPLQDAEITCEYQYGVSNEVLPGKTATVSVRDGKLLLIRIFRNHP